MRGGIDALGIGRLPDCEFQRGDLFGDTCLSRFRRCLYGHGSPAGENFLPPGFVVADAVYLRAVFEEGDPLIERSDLHQITPSRCANNSARSVSVSLW